MSLLACRRRKPWHSGTWRKAQLLTIKTCLKLQSKTCSDYWQIKILNQFAFFFTQTVWIKFKRTLLHSRRMESQFVGNGLPCGDNELPGENVRFFPSESTAWMKKYRTGRTASGFSPGPQIKHLSGLMPSQSQPGRFEQIKVTKIRLLETRLPPKTPRKRALRSTRIFPAKKWQNLRKCPKFS